MVATAGLITCYFGWFGDFLIGLSISRARGPYMYNLPYAYAYALRRITLVLMHILIQPPSSYKSSFSYKTSDSAETHDPSTHATYTVALIDLSLRMAGDDGPYGRLGDCCRADGIQPDLYVDEYVRVRTCTTIYIWPCGPLR